MVFLHWTALLCEMFSSPTPQNPFFVIFSNERDREIDCRWGGLGSCMPRLLYSLSCRSTGAHNYTLKYTLTFGHTHCTHSITLLISHSSPSFYPFAALHSSQGFASRLIAKVTAGTQLLPSWQGEWTHTQPHTQSNAHRMSVLCSESLYR